MRTKTPIQAQDVLVSMFRLLGKDKRYAQLKTVDAANG